MSNTNKLLSLVVLTGLFGGCASAPPQMTTQQYAALVGKIVSQVSELGGATVSSETQISGPTPPKVQIACACVKESIPNKPIPPPPPALNVAALDRGIKLLEAMKTVISLRAQSGGDSTTPIGTVSAAER